MKNLLKNLSIQDTIENGVFAGLTVKDCINTFGRRSILEILKYYNLDENILKAYHFHSKGKHKDNSNDSKAQDYDEERLEYNSHDLEDYEEWDSISEEEDDCYCGDDFWWLMPDYDFIYPWDVNEMQYPWEKEKSCFEYDLSEEDAA